MPLVPDDEDMKIYSQDELDKESALAYDTGFEDGYNEGYRDAMQDVDEQNPIHD